MHHPLRALRRVLLLALLLPLPLVAQGEGTLHGTVTRASDGGVIAEAKVTVDGTHLIAFTNSRGRYILVGVPAGSRTVRVAFIGYRPLDAVVAIQAGEIQTLDVALESQPVTLGDVVVYAASRAPERVVEAPAAVSTVDMAAAPALSATSQVPLALTTMPGVDLAQNDIHDFSVNARGFNVALNRRVLVLQDGRDLAIAFLSAQEWSAFTMPLEDFSRIEMVRGPGSALYGANAFSGVLSLTTPSAREVVGTKVSLAGGELGTFRADVRQAALFGGGRFGVRVNAGYNESRTWSRSRTGVGDFSREYSAAVDTNAHPPVHPLPGFELRPLNGQSLAGPPGTAAVGKPADEKDAYGGARFDYYAPGGSVLTAEGGIARVANMVFLSPVGRTQSNAALRPWGRLAWAADRYYLMAWYSGRNSIEPQYALASGAPVEDKSRIVHLEAQTNQPLFGGRGRVVLGSSVRNTAVNSERTLIAPQDDNRNDWSYSAYGQMEYSLGSHWRFVGAGRYDDGDLYQAQLSPKAAIVYSPNPNHSIRATINRAFLTPSTLEFFVRFPATAPADFGPLEAALRASPLGPALSGVPNGALFTTSSSVPVLVLGNPNLKVEHVTSLELGYKGQVGRRVYLALDAYYSRFSDFVTDILPGVNPTYAPWTAPAAVPGNVAPILEQAVRDALAAGGQPVAAAGLTRLPDGSTAVVLSVGNAGRVEEYGLEPSIGIRLGSGISVEANYSFVHSDLDAASLAPGQVLLPNTSPHQANLAIAYSTWPVDVRGSLHWVAGFDWASGIYQGYIPPSTTLDLATNVHLTDHLSAQAIVTNLLDQKRYHIFGGAVIGRRALVGMTVRH